MVKYSIFFDLGLIFGYFIIFMKYYISELKKEKKLKFKGFIVFKIVLVKNLR